jgi:hypothetical protein
MILKDLADHLVLGWDTTEDTLERVPTWRDAEPKHLRYLAVDQIAVIKEHHYSTVVVEAQKKRLETAEREIERVLKRVERSGADGGQVGALGGPSSPSSPSVLLHPANRAVGTVSYRARKPIRIARTKACPLTKSIDLGGGKPCKHHSWASSSR